MIATSSPAPKRQRRYVQHPRPITWVKIVEEYFDGALMTLERGRTVTGLSLPCERHSTRANQGQQPTRTFYLDGKLAAYRSETQLVEALTKLGIL